MLCCVSVALQDVSCLNRDSSKVLCDGVVCLLRYRTAVRCCVSVALQDSSKVLCDGVLCCVSVALQDVSCLNRDSSKMLCCV